MQRTKFPEKEVSDIVGQVVSHSKESTPIRKQVPCISTGSTMLNLAMSDHPRRGYPLGRISHIVGDSHTGKTILSLTALAEMAIDEQYDDYDFIFDDAEAANLFDMSALFGQRMADRVRPARIKKGMSLASTTIQDFHNNLRRALDRGRPFVYILDSFDAITSEEEQAKVQETLDAIEKGTEVKGSYGMDKPKAISQILRMCVQDICGAKSVLLIISQTRDNIDRFSFEKRTYSGGRSLKFYSSTQSWLAVGQTFRKGDYPIGSECVAKVVKTKLTGKVREVHIPIYNSYGVDDIGSCVDWLIDHKFWGKVEKEGSVKRRPDTDGKEKRLSKSGGIINASEFGLKLGREALVRKIEGEGLYNDLRDLVGVKWLEIEDALKLQREPRFK